MTDTDQVLAAVLAGHNTVVLGEAKPLPKSVTSLLTSDDAIVLVATGETGTATDLAMSVQAGLGTPKTVLVIDNGGFAASNSQHQAQVADILTRAISLSQDRTSVTRVFVQQVHAAQAQWRAETVVKVPASSPQSQATTQSEFGMSGLILGLVLAVAIAVTVVHRHLNLPRRQAAERVATPKFASHRVDEKPTARTADELRQVIDSLNRLLSSEQARVGSQMLTRTRQVIDLINSHLAAVADDWTDRVLPNRQLADELTDIALRYLPDAVNAYLAVPARARAAKAVAALLVGLEAVETRLAEVHDALDEDALDKLEVQGQFLSGKYRHAANPLNTD